METITIVQHNSERLAPSLHVGCSSSIRTTFHDTGLDTRLGREGVQGRTDSMTKRMGRFIGPDKRKVAEGAEQPLMTWTAYASYRAES